MKIKIDLRWGSETFLAIRNGFKVGCISGECWKLAGSPSHICRSLESRLVLAVRQRGLS